MLVGLVVLAVLAVGAAGYAAFTVLDDDDPGTERGLSVSTETTGATTTPTESTTTTAPAPTTTTATTTTTVPTTVPVTVASTAPPVTPAPTVPPAVAVPAGSFCRDLVAVGRTYAEAVAYWEGEGRPDRMDADRNGIPCETVYPRETVAAYWRPLAPPSDVASLPDGLYCRDLDARGFSYGDAVAYWYGQDSTDRMDADRNGIPCETVYPASDVSAHWG